MTPALLVLLVFQAPTAAPAPAPVQRPPTRPFAYRGFAPGMPYRDFAAQARAMSPTSDDILSCQTMHQTAQVMDCGVRVRDPVDSARFYLSANVIEGRTSVISFVDSGKVAIVDRMQADMRKRLGPPQRRERSMWEWTRGRRFIRLNWRGGRGWRVISITLNDRDVMNQIAKYVPKAKRRTP